MSEYKILRQIKYILKNKKYPIKRMNILIKKNKQFKLYVVGNLRLYELRPLISVNISKLAKLVESEAS